MDVDGLAFGDDFETKINGQLDRCAVLLALIGPQWEHLRDSATRTRRLDQTQDWVRCEIAKALQMGITVMPVLAGYAGTGCCDPA